MEYFLSVLLAFMQLVVALYITYFEYKNKSCGVYLWAMILVIFCLGHFHMLINYSSSYRYSLWVYNAASYFAFFFNIIYLIIRIFVLGKRRHSLVMETQKQNKTISMSQFFFMRCLFVIMCISAFVRIYHLAKYSGGLLSTSWGDMLNSGGGYFGIEQVFRILFYLSSSIIYPALYYKKNKLAITSILVVLLVTIITRNRADILPLLISVIAYILCVTKRINFQLIFRLSLFGFLSILLIYAILIFRFYGSVGNFIENADVLILAEDVMTMLQNSDEGDLSVKEAFYFFIEKDNEFPNFNLMHTYIRMALFFLPTQWSLGLKPNDFAETMGAAWEPGSEGFSMHPTLYGDCFANMYYWGVFLAVVWALIVSFLDRFLLRQFPVYRMCGIVIIGSAFIMIGRGSVYNPFVSIFYELMILYVIGVICRMLCKKKSKKIYNS